MHTPDLSRAARDYSDGMYHGNLEVTEHGYWVEAKDLRVGDVFLGASGELSVLTNAVRVKQDGGIAVFNFTVEGNHDYFVLAKEYEYGQSCILVHNAKDYDIWYDANGKLRRYEGSKPQYVRGQHHEIVNIEGKTPLPADAEEVFRRAVPNSPDGVPRAWFGMSDDGKIYRFSVSNNGCNFEIT